MVVIPVGLKSLSSPKSHSQGWGWGDTGPAPVAPAWVQEWVVERQGRREKEPGRPLWKEQHFGAVAFVKTLGWGKEAVAEKCVGLP